MAYLVLVRHGQSEWNLKNIFTGQTDVPLTDKGRAEARATGALLENIHFDAAYTSDLSRAKETLDIILGVLGQKNIPIIVDRAITERDYGEWVGLDKAETKKKYGDEAFLAVRRGWDTRPPNGESLKDTAARAVPYFEKTILPELTAGKNVIVSAHGNSIRAIMKFLEHISDADIPHREIPTGGALVYTFDGRGAPTGKQELSH